MSTKVPYDGCGRIWAGWQLREIMAFGESWLTSVLPKEPLWNNFAADNAITVECETWVEPSLAWAVSYSRWNVCLQHHLFSPSCSFTLLNQQVIHVTNGTSFMKKNQPMNKWNIWAYYGFEIVSGFGPFCGASPHHRRNPGRVQPGRHSFNFIM
jgi:hypothetical protein